jgi:hypothetical protein
LEREGRERRLVLVDRFFDFTSEEQQQQPQFVAAEQRWTLPFCLQRLALKNWQKRLLSIDNWFGLKFLSLSLLLELHSIPSFVAERT